MIDFRFIEILEGAKALIGYVPTDAGHVIGHSGVTIATGFDLGQQTLHGLEEMGFPESLIELYRPYLGLTEEPALLAAHVNPLYITKEQAEVTDKLVQAYYLCNLIDVFNKAQAQRNSGVRFDGLPDAAQTIIFSLWFNLGYLPKKAPKSWKYILDGNWIELITELMDFGHKNEGLTRRRESEAKYLAERLFSGTAET